MTIADEITKLDVQRKALADNLVVKSVVADQSETLSQLVPKVLQVPQEGGEFDPDWFLPNVYNYTGAVQTFTTPVGGTYKLEVWGAQGGGYSNNGNGGKGGYSLGEVFLLKNTELYVFVGGQGGSVNSAGGFNGGGSSKNYGGSGGGATDIRLGGSTVYSRIIVAGGGGGSGYGPSTPGGFGGGLSGGQGFAGTNSGGAGGTQTAGGTGSGGSGIFGEAVNSSVTGGAGGGGWYGGGAGSSGSVDAAAGGGSGYILTSDSYKPTGYQLGEDYYLTNAITYAGDSEFTSPFGVVVTGNQENGYARITLLNI